MPNFRNKTPRKARLWTTRTIALAMTVAGAAGQKSSDLSDAFTDKVQRNLQPSDTLAHTWIKGLWKQSTVGDLSPMQCAFGIGFYPSAIPQANLPDLLAHDGEWQTHDARTLLELPATTVLAGSPLLPEQFSFIDVESAGQRSVPRGGAAYSLFAVGAIGNTASGGVIELVATVTALWLIAA